MSMAVHELQIIFRGSITYKSFCFFPSLWKCAICMLSDNFDVCSGIDLYLIHHVASWHFWCWPGQAGLGIELANINPTWMYPPIRNLRWQSITKMQTSWPQLISKLPEVDECQHQHQHSRTIKCLWLQPISSSDWGWISWEIFWVVKGGLVMGT